MFTSNQDWFNGVCNGQYSRVQASIAVFGGTRDHEGMTGLMRVAISGDAEMCQILAISESCKITRNGMTALMYACQFNNAECCEILAPLERSIILSDCRTALMLAADAGSYLCCKCLLKFLGPERDSNGLSALEYAILRSHLSIVQLFVQDSNMGRTLGVLNLIECARLARREGYLDIAAWLDNWLLAEANVKNASSLAVSMNSVDVVSPNQYGGSPRNVFEYNLRANSSFGAVAVAAGSIAADGDNAEAAEFNTVASVSVSSSVAWSHANKSMGEVHQAEEDRAHGTYNTDTRSATNCSNFCDTASPSPGAGADTKHITQVELVSPQYAHVVKDLSMETDIVEHFSHHNSHLLNAQANMMYFGSTAGSPVGASNPAIYVRDNIAFQATDQFNAVQGAADISTDQDRNELYGSVIDNSAGAQRDLDDQLSSSDLDSGRSISEAVRTAGAVCDSLHQLQRSLDAATVYTDRVVNGSVICLDSDATPLMKAAVTNDLYLAQTNMSFARSVTQQNQTSLMLAIQSGSLRVARELIIVEAGFQDLNGQTALMYAAKLSYLDIVELLAPVESSMVDNHGCTALMYAAEHNHDEIANVLVRTEGCIRNNYGDTALHIAVASESIECIKCLAPVEARIRDSRNRVALMNACARRLQPACQILVEYEAGQVDEQGNTCLHTAVLAGNVSLATILAPKEHNIRNNMGKTALMLAIDSGNHDLVSVLSRFEASMVDSDSVTPLMLMSERGMLGGLISVVQNSGNMNQCDINGQSALVLALQSQQYEVAAQLSDSDGKTIAIQAQYNSRDVVKQVCVLKTAIQEDDIVTIWEVIRRLDPDKNELRHELLQYAIVSGKLKIAALIADSIWGDDLLKRYENELVKGVVDQGDLNKRTNFFIQRNIQVLTRNAATRKKIQGTSINRRGITRDSNGYTLLHIAVIQNDLIAVWETHIACATVPDSEGNTALMLAAINGHLECARVLLPYEAGIRRDSDGVTAMHLALSYRHNEIAELLAPKEAPDISTCRRVTGHQTELMQAAFLNDLPTCYSLRKLQQGLLDEERSTALMYAAKQGNAAAVGLLAEMEHGRQDKKSWTALMHAVFNGHVECVSILMKYEAAMTDVSGVTALMIAAHQGYSEIVDLLIPAEGSIQTHIGSTALISAARNGHTDIAELLLEYEAGLATQHGLTALMEAALHGHADIVKLLAPLESGFKTSADHPNGAGFTALMAAAQGDNPDCYEILLDYEKDIVQDNGTTAGDYATGPRMKSYLQ